MSPDPTFVFAQRSATRIGRGRTRAFDSVRDASAALADGSGAVVVGAFGFDPHGIASLFCPDTFVIEALPSCTAPLPNTIGRTVTSADVHGDRVRRALDAIADGRVEKAVLARTLSIDFDGPIDPLSLISRFPMDRRTTVFATPLDAAPGHDGCWLVGASPELLVRRSGDVVTCHPYAGSAPRSDDPATDLAARDALAASDKDLREHAFVVDAVVEALRPWCSELTFSRTPDIESTPAVWHLATPITGTLTDPTVTALDLAAELSPTPAVCGTPRSAAAELIEELEGSRDFYAGAVGWCDAAGDGEWVVSIRCLELDAAGTHVDAWAGGGIVAGSDPDAEVAETSAKFRTVLGALNI